jgi:hypothetical protein
VDIIYAAPKKKTFQFSIWGTVPWWRVYKCQLAHDLTTQHGSKPF